MEKIQKKCNFVFFCKNTKKYECNFSKIPNNKNFKNAKYKKNTNPKCQKYKIQRKYKFKNEPESQPHVHFGNQETNCKKIQNQPVVFSKPCSSDFVFLNCIVFFFLIWTEDPSVANADYSTLSSRVIDVAMAEAKKINHIHKNWDSVQTESTSQDFLF